VLYQLFDWPSQPGSRLAIIGISNTHDLDQRVLPRIASRLDQAKLAFAPYSATQLIQIVQDRLEGSGVAGAVDEAAVQVACRKVAAETGGARQPGFSYFVAWCNQHARTWCIFSVQCMSLHGVRMHVWMWLLEQPPEGQCSLCKRQLMADHLMMLNCLLDYSSTCR
jgi:hypothetical protein